MPQEPVAITPKAVLIWSVVALLVMVLVVGVGVGGCAGLKAFNRAQARANANNQVAITHIQKARQQARINYAEIQATIAEAQKRYQEAIGIRRAQDEISKTLTPLYIQHEAIQAEQQIASSGSNNTVVYVPSGAQGVPVVTAQASKGK